MLVLQIQTNSCKSSTKTVKIATVANVFAVRIDVAAVDEFRDEDVALVAIFTASRSLTNLGWKRNTSFPSQTIA